MSCSYHCTWCPHQSLGVFSGNETSWMEMPSSVNKKTINRNAAISVGRLSCMYPPHKASWFTGKSEIILAMYVISRCQEYRCHKMSRNCRRKRDQLSFCVPQAGHKLTRYLTDWDQTARYWSFMITHYIPILFKLYIRHHDASLIPIRSRYSMPLQLLLHILLRPNVQFRAKHNIPKLTCHTISKLIVLVMMSKMIFLELPPVTGKTELATYRRDYVWWCRK